VCYKDITARKIIFCNGAVCAENPWFSKLPWSKDKGEALIASIPGLPADNIYKQGINIVPWQHGLFWIGATHDWKFTDMLPSESFRKQTEEHLNYWLKLPYTIIDHIVAARPTNLERKPFAGLHPGMPSVGIFNGMGTKGCSVVPYFANQFAKHLVHNVPIMPDVDVKRFMKILSR
jgi:glycine/D-amino acid oxidase-like deaminating enzyme